MLKMTDEDVEWGESLGEIFCLTFVRGVEETEALARLGALPDTLGRRPLRGGLLTELLGAPGRKVLAGGSVCGLCDGGGRADVAWPVALPHHDPYIAGVAALAFRFIEPVGQERVRQVLVVAVEVRAARRAAVLCRPVLAVVADLDDVGVEGRPMLPTRFEGLDGTGRERGREAVGVAAGDSACLGDVGPGDAGGPQPVDGRAERGRIFSRQCQVSLPARLPGCAASLRRG
ncbi:hypothetical protein [Actinomadura sp. NPDC049753]|uniref:hypothetical protein n=1 Tax=Actinomadura sp. NPDC049753 TaxID=3154739 RepID=UPI00344398BE